MHIIVLSGHMLSGKDTVADKLVTLLPGKSARHTYSNILRADFDKILAIVKESDNRELMLQRLLRETSLPVVCILDVVNDFTLALQNDPHLNSRSRTTDNRDLLQKLGSTWVPSRDYLPREMSKIVEIDKDNNCNSIITGGRYPLDMQLFKDCGATTVRLDVTRETQLRRLRDRDGLLPSQEVLDSLDHPGEHALDNWDFDIRMNNDTDGEIALDGVCERISTTIIGGAV